MSIQMCVRGIKCDRIAANRKTKHPKVVMFADTLVYYYDNIST